MNKFLIVKYKHNRDSLLQRLRSHFLSEIPFHVAHIQVYDFPANKILVAAAQPAVSGFGAKQHTYVSESRGTFLTFDGVPYLAQQDFAGEWAESLFTHLQLTSPLPGAADILGAYCLTALMGTGELVAYGDFAGLYPLYYYASRDSFAISNRQRLLHAILDDGVFTFDLQAYSWLTGQGNIFGRDSPYAGVKLIRPGDCVIVSGRRVSIERLPTRSWCTAEHVREDFTDDDVDAIYDSLVQQMKALGRLPFRSLQLELSGGLDSRVVLALAIAAGTIDRVEKVLTTGLEGSPEIEAAKRVAHLFDLPWTAQVMAPQSVDVDAWWGYVGAHCFRYEGTVAPPDGMGRPGWHMQPAFSGTGGEIYRPHVKAHKHLETPDRRTAQRLFEDYQQKNDPLGLQHARVTRHQRRAMRNLVRAYAKEGVSPNDMRYVAYVDNRLPWWAGGLHANDMRRLRMYPLVNWRAAKIIYSVNHVQRQIDRVHFEILRRVDRRLVEFPFASYAWDPRLTPYIERHTLQPDRLPLSARRNGSAAEHTPVARQFMLEAWEHLLDRLTDDRNAPLYEIVDALAVANLRDRRDKTVRSVLTVKQVFALLAIKETTENRVRRELMGPVPETRILLTNIPTMRGLEESQP